MADGGPKPAIIVSALLIILGIIHFGVGVGIVARYRQYGNTFQQSVGLCGFNIVIGLFSIAVGAVALVAILSDRGVLSKVAAIMSAVLAVITLASLIAALAINSQAISFVRTRLFQYTNAYAQDNNAMDVTDKIQSRYECCGVNLWLDWASISLGVTGGTGSSTQTGRRRRHEENPTSFLTRSLRLKRQVVTTPNTVYNLPSTYTFNLPLTCCINGGTASGNSVGGYCVFDSSNSSGTFYLTGCLPTVANLVVSQITGLVLINTLLVILALVFIPVLISLFPADYDPNNPKNQPRLQTQLNQEEQQQQQQPQNLPPGYNGGFYPNGVNPNVNYGYAAPPYVVYQ